MHMSDQLRAHLPLITVTICFSMAMFVFFKELKRTKELSSQVLDTMHHQQTYPTIQTEQPIFTQPEVVQDIIDPTTVPMKVEEPEVGGIQPEAIHDEPLQPHDVEPLEVIDEIEEIQPEPVVEDTKPVRRRKRTN